MYNNKLNGFAVIGTPGAASLAAAGVLANRFVATRNLKLSEVGICLSVAINSVAAVVVTVKKRILLGSATGESTICTLTIPTTGAVKEIYFKRFNAVEFAPGQELCFDVTTAAGTAGSGLPLALDVSECPETDANQSLMIASA